MTGRRATIVGAVLALVLPLLVGVPTAPTAGAAGGVQVEQVLFGPFDLAATGSGGWQDEGSGLLPRPPGAYGITAMYFDVVDATGTPVAAHDVHLHHIVMAEYGTPDPVCGNLLGTTAAVVAAAGSERTPIEFGGDYAYLVQSGDQWVGNWHIMNMSDTARQVYISYEVHYDTSLDASNSRPLTPLWMDVDGCGDAEWDVPGDGGAGSTYSRTRDIAMPAAGVLAYVGGHLHEGGIANELRRRDTGELLCRNDVHGEMHGHLTIDPCAVEAAVADGEVLRLESIYDNSAPIEGAMGIDVGYLWAGGTLPETGSIAGTVTDEVSGAPLAGIRARLQVDGVWAAWVDTDAAGGFSFDGLEPSATYRVRWDDLSGTYPREFFDDASHISGAAVVPVTAGVTTTVDAALMASTHHGEPVCDQLGAWADWMPPHDWTDAQVDAAQQLICDAYAEAPALDTVAEATAAGYQWIGDGGGTGYEHWVHEGYLATPEVFDLATVESVVFRRNADGSRSLAALMPMLPMGSTFDDIPAEWAWLPGWHVHEDLCFNADGTVAGIAGPNGSCPGSSVLVVTPPMTHIWVEPNECDDPFSGVDQHGVQCGGHEGH